MRQYAPSSQSKYAEDDMSCGTWQAGFELQILHAMAGIMGQTQADA